MTLVLLFWFTLSSLGLVVAVYTGIEIGAYAGLRVIAGVVVALASAMTILSWLEKR